MWFNFGDSFAKGVKLNREQKNRQRHWKRGPKITPKTCFSHSWVDF